MVTWSVSEIILSYIFPPCVWTLTNLLNTEWWIYWIENKWGSCRVAMYWLLNLQDVFLKDYIVRNVAISGSLGFSCTGESLVTSSPLQRYGTGEVLFERPWSPWTHPSAQQSMSQRKGPGKLCLMCLGFLVIYVAAAATPGLCPLWLSPGACILCAALCWSGRLWSCHLYN